MAKIDILETALEKLAHIGCRGNSGPYGYSFGNEIA